MAITLQEMSRMLVRPFQAIPPPTASVALIQMVMDTQTPILHGASIWVAMLSQMSLHNGQMVTVMAMEKTQQV